MIIHSAVIELLYSYERRGRRPEMRRGVGQNNFNIRISQHTNPPKNDEMRHNFYAICKLSDYVLNAEETVHYEYALPKQNGEQAYYLQILEFFGNLIV
jgi:hypothetical protein